jgi:hypothetical protein
MGHQPRHRRRPPTAGAPSLSAQRNAARLRSGATTPAKTSPLPAALDAAGLDEDPAETLPQATRCALGSTGL